MSVEEARAGRKAAGERLLVAWGAAIVPNTLAAFGVSLPGAWWWYAIWISLSAVLLVALLAWLMSLWRERQARHAVSDSALYRHER
jgi:protein-S-isoprenylcysteine O-methyltransferase Ste14